MAVKLTEALDIFQQENSLNYDDNAPSTQHEELEQTVTNYNQYNI